MPEDAELSRIEAILAANKEKSFVQRILKPQDYPTLHNDDGTVSTHKMAWTTGDDGKAYVYPTILLNAEPKLTEFSPKVAWEHARRTGNFISFDKPLEADWFSKQYKRVWEGKNAP